MFSRLFALVCLALSVALVASASLSSALAPATASLAPAVASPSVPCETDAQCVRQCEREGYSLATCTDAMRTGRELGTVLEEEGYTN